VAVDVEAIVEVIEVEATEAVMELATAEDEVTVADAVVRRHFQRKIESRMLNACWLGLLTFWFCPIGAGGGFRGTGGAGAGPAGGRGSTGGRGRGPDLSRITSVLTNILPAKLGKTFVTD
jgi:hypothetical protein